MQSSNFLVIRNARTHAELGFKEIGTCRITVPVNGELENFIVRYQALNNYDMGNVVELYDREKQLVIRFAILYSFKKVGTNDTSSHSHNYYDVLEEPLENLEMIEILDTYNKKERKNARN